MKIALKEIEAEYIRHAKRFNIEEPIFPFGEIPDDFGGRHLELGLDGNMALIATDRGNEMERQETHSLDELMYWIFESYAYSRAWDYELNNRHPTHDSRRIAFAKALEEIEKLSQDWRDRLYAEQQEILSRNPYRDQSS